MRGKAAGNIFRIALIVLALLLPAVVVSAALALEAPAAREDAELDARVRALSYELRCLVCQNESIAESRAPLAQDLRAQVREQLAAGKSESEVIDFMVARYGDFVLYRPPFKATTALLWLGPALLLLAGGGWLIYRLRGRERESPPELSKEEHARARALLEGRPEDQTEEFRS